MANEDDRATKMKSFYDKGYSLRQVGEAFGVSGPAVHNAFRLRGWQCRPHKQKEVDPADLEELGINSRDADGKEG